MNRQRFVVTGPVWSRHEPHLPGKASDAGATAKDNRLFLEAVFWFGPAHHGATFRLHSASGTASSGVSADGPTRACSRVFSTL